MTVADHDTRSGEKERDKAALNRVSDEKNDTEKRKSVAESGTGALPRRPRLRMRRQPSTVSL